MNVRALALPLLGVFAACGGAEPAPETSSTSRETVEAPATATLGLPNERRLNDGLVVGGQPDEAAITRASEAGSTTVISLRTSGEPGFEEEQAQVEALGMSFVSIPVDGAGGLTEENARALDSALTSPETTVLHCGSGNRVGALLAIRAFYVERTTRAAALELGRAAGLTSLEGAVSEHLDTACADVANADRC